MTAPGSIYDLGYQGYEGPRLSRATVAIALLRQTLNAAFGIGRGGRAKVVPFGLAVLALLPALLAVGISALIGQVGPAGPSLEEASPIRHETYYSLVSVLIMLFCAAQAPELFGRDQRYGVLPLYFSRALERSDYALARMGGLAVGTFLIAAVPHLVLTLGAMLAASDPIAGLSDEAPDIPRWLAMSALTAGLLASIASAIAAWTPRRAYATAAIIGVFIVPPILVALVAELAAGDLARLLVLASPGDVLDGANAAVFGTFPDSPAVAAADLPDLAYPVVAVVAIAAGVALVLRRYLRVTV